MNNERKFTIRLTDKDLKLLDRNANNCHLTKSAYIRHLINGYIPKEAPFYSYHGMMNELSAIGNSLNQIAYVANASEYIDAEKFKELVRLLFAKVMEINNAVLSPERMKK